MLFHPRAGLSYKNDEGDLVVMDMDVESFTRREKMLKLWEELLAVEEDLIAGRMGCTPDEMEIYLDGIINEVEHDKNTAI